MKISSHQVRAALEAYIRGVQCPPVGAAAPPSGPPPVDALQQRMSELPEERDILVHDLRAKVRRGRYFVSSGEIVDALLGRLTADLLNQE